jgi:allophanate hydrolase subunit 1
LRPGDVVKFDAISGKEYEQIKAAVIKGTFKVGKEVYSG